MSADPFSADLDQNNAAAVDRLGITGQGYNLAGGDHTERGLEHVESDFVYKTQFKLVLNRIKKIGRARAEFSEVSGPVATAAIVMASATGQRFAA